MKGTGETRAFLSRLRGGHTRLYKLNVKKASGSRVYSVEGKEYIDLTGGYQVMLLGHDFEPLKRATIAQMNHLDFHNPGIASIQLDFAKAICGLVSEFMDDPSVSFTNSGSECAELIFQTVQNATDRCWVASCSGAYIGGLTAGRSLTFDGLSISSRNSQVAKCLTLPYPYHKGHEPRTCEAYRDAVEYIFSTQVTPDEIAALFIEPVQAHGGVRLPCPHCISYLAEFCRENGIILVCDEVVTGLGRTGKMFGVENFDISPEIFYLGKPVGGGIPLGVIVSNGENLAQTKKGGTTCSGNVLACARGLTLLNYIRDEDLPTRALVLGEKTLKRMNEWATDFDFLSEERGIGLLLGLEFQEDAAPLAAEAQKQCFKKGLLFALNGIQSNVIKLTPPLNIKEEDLKQGLDVIEAVLKRLAR